MGLPTLQLHCKVANNILLHGELSCWQFQGNLKFPGAREGKFQVPGKQAELEIAQFSAWAAEEGLWSTRGWGFNTHKGPGEETLLPPELGIGKDGLPPTA